MPQCPDATVCTADACVMQVIEPSGGVRALIDTRSERVRLLKEPLRAVSIMAYHQHCTVRAATPAPPPPAPPPPLPPPLLLCRYVGAWFAIAAIGIFRELVQVRMPSCRSRHSGQSLRPIVAAKCKRFPQWQSQVLALPPRPRPSPPLP